MIRIIESPREAMQGLQRIIPTRDKIMYLNSLMNVGFDTIETGSFVSPGLIPQMADSLEVLSKIDMQNSKSHIMFLVVSKKGTDVISTYENVSHISYPHSISPAFLHKNLNSDTNKSLETVEYIVEICQKTNKVPVIYISLAFGNSFNDAWNLEILEEGVQSLYDRGIRTIPLSNVSIEISADHIKKAFNYLLPKFPDVEFGLHLHTSNIGFMEKVNAAYEAGVRRFDSVMTGLGGCPFAEDELLGNLSTENLLLFIENKKLYSSLDKDQLEEARLLATKVLY